MFVLLIVVGPILTIWALNTLFPVLQIPYDVKHWFAAAIINLLISSRV